MTSEPTRITDVELRVDLHPRYLWRIHAADGTRYATSDPWMAALAKRLSENGATVTCDYYGAWYSGYYRDLLGLATVEAGG